MWRLVGPGSDSELIRPRCAPRYAEALHADWKHGPRLTRSTSSKNLNEIKNKLRIKKKKARQKAAVEPPRRAALTFVVVLLCRDISKRKKVSSTQCLMNVRLEVSVEVKPSTYDVA